MLLSTIQLNHPGGAAGYIVEKENKKVCVFLDHEYGQESTVDDELLTIARESDLIVWDGMFLNEELPPKKVGDILVLNKELLSQKKRPART